MNIEQILAIVIFAIMFIAVMSGEVHRYIPALIGAVLTSILILTVVEPGSQNLRHVL